MNLVGKPGEVHVERQLRIAKRPKEVVEMARNDQFGRERSHDALDVMVCEPATCDSAQEHVDVAILDLVLDQIGGTLMIEAHPGDLDKHAPHLATAIRLRSEVIQVLARQLA